MMPVTPLAVCASGMVTSVGLNVKSTSAAIHCSIDNFQETQFLDENGEWQIGATVPFDQPIRGSSKLLYMLKIAVEECLKNANCSNPGCIPLILSLPETDRPGRLVADDKQFFLALADELDLTFSEASRLLCHGHTSAAVALKRARHLIESNQADKVLIAGVDSLLCAATLRFYEKQGRLLNSENSNGFIPGEGAAALLVEKATGQPGQMLIHGLGFAVEKACLNSGLPLRADGLSQAINASLEETGCQLHELDHRIADVTGEHYFFKEASLALSRCMKQVVSEFNLLHPADCIGEVGAPVGHIILSYQFQCARRDRKKRILAHFGDTDGKRAAIVLSYS